MDSVKLNWPYLAVIGVLLVASGLGEIYGLVPHGSFYGILLLTVGLVSPSPVFPHIQVSSGTTQVTGTKVEVEEKK